MYVPNISNELTIINCYIHVQITGIFEQWAIIT